MMKQTEWKTFTEHGQKYRIRAEYGMDYEFARRNNQAPHFSLTMTQERWERGRWQDDSGGTAHESIVQHFSELAPYVKWHLVATDGPIHYIANAKYWWEIATGKLAPSEHQRIDPWDAFKSTIIFGGLPTDEVEFPLKGQPWDEVKAWLMGRRPLLMETFQHAMTTLGVLE